MRAVNIGLEARLTWKVHSNWKIMEWIGEQAGNDGRTVYFRQHGRNSTKAILEIGDQMMAKLQIPEEVIFETWAGLPGMGWH